MSYGSAGFHRAIPGEEVWHWEILLNRCVTKGHWQASDPRGDEALSGLSQVSFELLCPKKVLNLLANHLVFLLSS